MDLQHAKRIGYHFQDLSPRPDPESHIPWVFAHALTPLPEPIEKGAVYLVEDELEAYWLAKDRETSVIFRVSGEISANDEKPNWPHTDTKIESRLLSPDRWTTSMQASYRHAPRQSRYMNKWEFHHLDGFSVTINSEREWDGGDDWISDDREKFAHLLVAELGWGRSPDS